VNDDLKDILLDGETVLWRGAPDIEAGDKAGRWQAFRINLLWITGGLAVGSFLLWNGLTHELSIFLQVVNALFLMLAAALVIVPIVNLVTYKHYDRSDERYILTNRRLLIINSVTSEQHSAFPNAMTSIDLRRNGKVHNLTIAYGFDGEDWPSITLHAIHEGALVKRQFLNILNPQSKVPSP